MGLKERVEEVRDAVGSNAELARIAEVSRASVTKWLAGDVEALKAVPALNIEEGTGYLAKWLVLGKGPKRAQALGVAEPAGHYQVTGKSHTTDGDKLLIIVRAFLDSDSFGRDAIWTGAKVALKKHGSARPRRTGSSSGDT